MKRQSLALYSLLTAAAWSVLTDAFVWTTTKKNTHNGGIVSSSTRLFAGRALIVQNKGGGHGELGYHLVKTLQSNYAHLIDSNEITILQDSACKMDSAEPFKSYATDLPHVRVVQAPLGNDDACTAQAVQQLLGDKQRYDYIWDNASKGPVGIGLALCELAQQWQTGLYTYVSSAGMYQPSDPNSPAPMAETTPIKQSAGQAQFEQYSSGKLSLPLVSFRPQYIYGPKANKFDYLDWFFDRLVRGLPLPIPGDGTQRVSLTHAADVAAILVSPLHDEGAAKNQIYFNCGTDQLHTYNDVAYMCAAAAGIPADQVNIVHYDAELFGKANFPFRPNNFYVAPELAKDKLRWPGPRHNLAEDLIEWYYPQYVQRGGPTRKLSLVKDWEIVVGSKTTWPENVMSVYDKWDPLVVDTSDVQQLKQ